MGSTLSIEQEYEEDDKVKKTIKDKKSNTINTINNDHQIDNKEVEEIEEGEEKEYIYYNEPDNQIFNNNQEKTIIILNTFRNSFIRSYIFKWVSNIHEWENRVISQRDYYYQVTTSKFINYHDWLRADVILMNGYINLIKDKVKTNQCIIWNQLGAEMFVQKVPSYSLFRYVFDRSRINFVYPQLLVSACKGGNLEIVKFLYHYKIPTEHLLLLPSNIQRSKTRSTMKQPTPPPSRYYSRDLLIETAVDYQQIHILEWLILEMKTPITNPNQIIRSSIGNEKVLKSLEKIMPTHLEAFIQKNINQYSVLKTKSIDLIKKYIKPGLNDTHIILNNYLNNIIPNSYQELEKIDPTKSIDQIHLENRKTIDQLYQIIEYIKEIYDQDGNNNNNSNNNNNIFWSVKEKVNRIVLEIEKKQSLELYQKQIISIIEAIKLMRPVDKEIIGWTKIISKLALKSDSGILLIPTLCQMCGPKLKGVEFDAGIIQSIFKYGNLKQIQETIETQPSLATQSTFVYNAFIDSIQRPDDLQVTIPKYLLKKIPENCIIRSHPQIHCKSLEALEFIHQTAGVLTQVQPHFKGNMEMYNYYIKHHTTMVKTVFHDIHAQVLRTGEPELVESFFSYIKPDVRPTDFNILINWCLFSSYINLDHIRYILKLSGKSIDTIQFKDKYLRCSNTLLHFILDNTTTPTALMDLYQCAHHSNNIELIDYIHTTKMVKPTKESLQTVLPVANKSSRVFMYYFENYRHLLTVEVVTKYLSCIIQQLDLFHSIVKLDPCYRNYAVDVSDSIGNQDPFAFIILNIYQNK